MSIYKPSLDVMVESINRLNKLDLVAAEYVFGTPEAIEPDGLFNTQILVTAKNQDSAYSGSRTFRYHRMDLSELATQVTLSIPVKMPTHISDILAAVNRRFGTVFEEQDIADRSLTTDEKAENATITLRAEPASLAWLGEVDVATRIGGYLLADYLKNTRLNGLNYPSPTTTRPYAQIYSFWRDFSTSYDQLKDIVPGTSQLDVLSAVLAFQTGDAWPVSGVSRYSLQGATVTHVGLADAPGAEANDRFDHYIKVQLSDTYSTGLTGELTLHFNAPGI